MWKIFLLLCFVALAFATGLDEDKKHHHHGYPAHHHKFHDVSEDSPQLTPNIQLSFGDMALTPLQRYSLDRQRLGYNAVIGAHLRWKDAIIPYAIDCSIENLPDAVESIHKAMAQWERKTCIRFVKHTNQKYFLTFFRNTHCWGNVGQVSYSRISVGYGCEYEHVMAHEIGHVVGLYHEQNRKDRDDWVKVHWENIGAFRSAFEIVNNTDPLGIAYDYESIMHYPWTAFSSNGKVTMEPIKPLKGKVPYIEISKDDIKLVSRMYNCPAIEKKRHHGRTRYRVANEKIVCVDQHKECPMWRQWGHCKISDRVLHDCPKSCRKECGGGMDPLPTQPPATRQPHKKWPKGWPNRNYLGIGKLCIDHHKMCAEWAEEGECKRNPGYMLRSCMKSCRAKGFKIVCDSVIPKPPGKCANPLGLAWDGTNNRTIPDSAFFAPEFLKRDDWTAPASSARLYFEDDYKGKKVGSWCAASHKPQYVQVDLGHKKTINYIATQGRPKFYERTEYFQVQYSDTASNFKTYQEDGKDMTFTGNCDHRTPVLNHFKSSISARYIRYIPLKWNWPCVRMELYGC